LTRGGPFRASDPKTFRRLPRARVSLFEQSRSDSVRVAVALHVLVQLIKLAW
jgi:hypothetical protein